MQKLVVAGCLLFGTLIAQASAVKGTIGFQGDTVHFELSGQQNWDYDLKKVEKNGQAIVEMTIPSVDAKSLEALKAFKHDYISSVQVDPQGIDGKNIVRFHLSSQNIETFDYLTDQPSRLIVDFYLNPQVATKLPDKKEAKSAPVKKPAKVAKTKSNNKTDKNSDRKPATADALTIADQGPTLAQLDPVRSGIFDGGDPDYSRFSVKDYEIKEDALIKAQDNYYIPFPILEFPVALWEKAKMTPTIYDISVKNTDENKQARLLLTLFEKERDAVFLKTQDWFKDKYPNSEYHEVLDFMAGDVHLRLWEKDQKPFHYEQAVQAYKDAVTKYPKSPLAEKTSLKLGFLSMEKGDYLNALRLFNEHLENKNFADPKSLSKDLARLGTGLSYLKLNRSEEARKELSDLEKNTKNHDIKVEAAYRLGDVAFKSKDYSKAITDYKSSIKNYGEGQASYPNAFFNQAESLFWKKDYLQSLDLYKEFVKRFPSHEHSAYAMTRMGELLDILGVDTSRVMGAYLETYFRYGESPSAVIARLRLLSARMKGMKPKEVNSAVGEIMSLAKKVDLPNIEQFATVMVADGFTRRDEYQRAIDLLSKYYKEHPTTVDVPLVTGRIVSNINDKLQHEIDEKNFLKALKTHSEYRDNWLKNSNRLDTKYNVGRAFEMGGVPDEAQKYYKDVLNRTYAIRGTPQAKEIQVKEQIPTEDEMNLRLSAVYAQENKLQLAYEHLNNIKTPEKMSEKDQIERVGIAVQLLESRDDIDSAVRYLGELLRTWKGEPQRVAAPYLKLAELQVKQKKSDEALKALEMVDKMQTDSGKVDPAIHAKSLEMSGDLQMELHRKPQAIASYNKLLESYEDSRPLSSIRYKLGQIYFDQGEVQKAAEVWSEFKDKKNSFWNNLAQEQLKNSEWRDGYKKYIKRIPAMSENEQSK